MGRVAALLIRATFHSAVAPPFSPVPSPTISHRTTHARRSFALPPVVFNTLHAVLECVGDHRVERKLELGRDDGIGSVCTSVKFREAVEGDILEGSEEGAKT